MQLHIVLQFAVQYTAMHYTKPTTPAAVVVYQAVTGFCTKLSQV